LKKELITAGFILTVLSLCFFNWYCSSPKKTEEKERTTYAGLSDSAKYVGMETCKGCHSGIHETFSHTGMGMSFDVASKEKSVGEYSKQTQIYDADKNFYYHPYWKGDSLFFKEFRLEGKDTIHNREENIRYIVGSGQHTNSHIWESNGYLFQAPMTFYTQKKKWDLPPGFEDRNNTRFGRKIGLECMSCHNAFPEFVAGSENKFSLVKNGIDCERCHGPGSIHVREKSSGILIDTSKYIDYSIVNPSKLPIDLQFDLCQRCHIQGNVVLNEGKSFFDFKPGMKLSDVMNVFMPVYKNSDEQHIMASHAERLKMSKCFLKVSKREHENSNEKTLRPFKNGLTCITCHNPHVSVKKTAKANFNLACANCHQSGKDPLCTEKSALRVKKEDNCVGCHMPQHGASDIPHVSVHDHRIGIHKEQVKNPDHLREFIGITCINNSQTDPITKAQAYINYVEKFGMEKNLLDSALKYLNEGVDPEKQIHQRIQIAYLQGNSAKVVQYAQRISNLLNQLKRQSKDNRDAWTSYRIGESYQLMGDVRQALIWYKNAYQLAPLSAEFTNKYANALALTGDNARAKELFQLLLKEHPYFAPGYCNMGYLILVQERNIKSAQALFDKALKLDPDYELALLNKANAYMLDYNKPMAIATIQRVLKINPGNLQAKTALQSLK
jgi:Tfp pilus assembly protein PilF